MVDAEGNPVEGVRVVAVTQLGIGSAAEGSTSANGGFSLPTVAGASYTVMIMPDPATGLGRLQLGDVLIDAPVTTITGEGAGGSLRLPPGLILAGRVVFMSGSVAGALIQAIPSGVAGEPVIARLAPGVNPARPGHADGSVATADAVAVA